MTLLGAILKKVQSHESMKQYPSPPPEWQEILAPRKEKRRLVNRLGAVRAVVDSQPPRLEAPRASWRLRQCSRDLAAVHAENVRLLMAIRRLHFMRGYVDSRWEGGRPPGAPQYYARRVAFARRVQRDNHQLHRLITTTGPIVTRASEHAREWRRARASAAPAPRGSLELDAFRPPEGVTRPRAYIALRVRGGAALGALRVELFAEACPRTCALFRELAAAAHPHEHTHAHAHTHAHTQAQAGKHSYRGTVFFTKVPHLYWSGGDVTHRGGFGCYAPRGRRTPIPAENYHFPHSIPGLLSMRVSADDEVCGSFNVTFKPLPQFDLKNVVFGRVLLPCRTYDSISALGAALSSQPVVEIQHVRLVE